MKKEVFDQAFRILNKIEKIDEALSCFERQEYDGDGNPTEIVNLNPSLFIEHDDEDDDGYIGRSMTEIPIKLNFDLISLIRRRLFEEKVKLAEQFNSL